MNRFSKILFSSKNLTTVNQRNYICGESFQSLNSLYFKLLFLTQKTLSVTDDNQNLHVYCQERDGDRFYIFHFILQKLQMSRALINGRLGPGANCEHCFWTRCYLCPAGIFDYAVIQIKGHCHRFYRFHFAFVRHLNGL